MTKNDIARQEDVSSAPANQAEVTALDRAHQAMSAAPEDERLRMRFYERLIDSELFLLLEAEPHGDGVIEPVVFPVDGGQVILAFDRDSRLSDFVGRDAPYAALSGRALIAMIEGQALGLGLNLGVAASEVLLDATAVAWLSGMIESQPAEVAETPEEIGAPENLPQDLLTGLDTKLALAAGMAASACLVRVTYRGGRRGHLLAFIGAQPGAEPALTTAAGEALRFSGLDAGEMDVGFFQADDPVAERLARVGLRFDLPLPPEAVPLAPMAPPGSDPDRPPRLK
ncbi:hypothetical protein BV394_04920 [Brevirhabdus pacifica]|uniref:SseB protein N-terminal domain-containing protein n=1 Tax=Brevirhabdus pacifica TaxID=1267768 RepID=A0A1U7DGY6_9RHOB|nr:SseB family protein [Brevirhabdus pacifica]APX89138.1 hypothetical protein BV394_04920 [Brevirhabdus pacifica]PJJ86270.1 type III secretion system (T3SS) SseB-like protein [Brevirhabdus pacifica]